MPDPVARKDRWVLAIDLGASGPKVGLVSLTGSIAWHEHRPVTTDVVASGGATQDAALWWDLVCDSARRGLATGVLPVGQVVAVSCTGQWASTVPVDGSGLPVSPCQLWSDTRGGPHTRGRGRARRRVRTGGRTAVDPPQRRGTLDVGRRPEQAHAPSRARRARDRSGRPLVPGAGRLLSMRFTGTASATAASMARGWLTDNRRAAPLDYDPVLVEASGVPAAKLPPLGPTAGIVGTVLSDVAADLGLPDGVGAVAGTPDLHSACVGSGAILPLQPHVAISTTSWVSCPFPRKKTDPVRQMATVPGVLPGLRLVTNNQESAGRALEWLPDSSRERQRGGFHNLSLRTTRNELVRAVLEGVALNSRLAGPRRRAVRRPVPRHHPGRQRRGDVVAVVLHLRQHARPASRAGRRPSPGQPARCGTDRRTVTGRSHSGRGAPARPCCQDPPPRPGRRRRLRAAGPRVPEFPKLYSAQRRGFNRLAG
jgi:xylulokinase